MNFSTSTINDYFLNSFRPIDPTLRKINTYSSPRISNNSRLPPLSKDNVHYYSSKSAEGNKVKQRMADDRIRQLEKHLDFIKDHHHMVLKCLHCEIDELKRKNRDLQFQLVMNSTEKQHNSNQIKFKSSFNSILNKEFVSPQIIEYIYKLETEVRRLRFALGETLKMNAYLRTQMLCFKSQTNINQSYEDNNNNVHSSHCKSSIRLSPKVDEFKETLKAINSSELQTKSFLPQIK